MKLTTERKLTFILFLTIPMLCFLTFIVYPIGKSIVLSFNRWDGISPHMAYVGLENYQRLFSNPRFWTALNNNLKWLIFSLVFPTSLGLALALLLDQKVKGESVFQTIFFIPYTITPVAVAAVWRWLFEPRSGLLNRLLREMGLRKYMQIWIGDPNIATYSIMLTSLWWTTGFALVLYISGLRSIPLELIEAAEIDGARFPQKFRFVMLPQLLPSTIVALAMSGINALRVFDLIYALTGGGPGYSTEVLATMMFDVSFNRFEQGLGSAIAVILLLSSAVIILPYVYHSGRGLEEIRN